MPRRKAAVIRETTPDGVHNSRLVQQLINKVMLDGKKNTAERIVYPALDKLADKSGKEPVEALEAAIKAVRDSLESEDAAEIKSRTDALQAAFHKVSAQMYEKAQSEQAAASDNGAASEGSAEEEVVDAEVVDEAK